MKRSYLNFFIDIIAFIGFAVLTTTGVLMRYILPPGSGHYSTLWNLDRHEWGNIHFRISVAFFSILTLHLILHWRWIVNVITGRPGETSGIRAGLGIIGLLATLGLAISPLIMPVETDLNNKEGTRLYNNIHEGIFINGSVTLKELETRTGVPAIYIIESFKLPQSTSVNQQLGHLEKKYGIEMNAIRKAVKDYKNRN